MDCTCRSSLSEDLRAYRKYLIFVWSWLIVIILIITQRATSGSPNSTNPKASFAGRGRPESGKAKKKAIELNCGGVNINIIAHFLVSSKFQANLINLAWFLFSWHNHYA